MASPAPSVSELAAVTRQQARQANGAFATGDPLEAGMFLLDALCSIASALERLEAQLEEIGGRLP